MIIQNERIDKLDSRIISTLKSLLAAGIPISEKNPNLRGFYIERLICNHLSRKGLNGFELNKGLGKDCDNFEIKSMVVNSAGRPVNSIKISGIACDNGKKFQNSNFYNKTKLILFICSDSDLRLVDILLSNFSISQLGLGYYGHNDLFKVVLNKFSLREKHFISNTISIKDIQIEEKSFIEWMHEANKKSFISWLKTMK